MPIDPSTFTGKSLWARAKDLGAGGSAITSWTDQSGRGNSVSINTSPTVAAASTPSGGKSVRFNNNPVNLAASTALGLLDSPYIATASTFYNTGSSFPPSNLTDGSASTEWVASSSAMPQWIKYEVVAGPTVVTSYTLRASGRPYFSSWVLEGSNDDSSWTTLDTRSSITFSGSTAQTFTFSNSTAYKFYRITASAKAGSGVEVGMADWSLSSALTGLTVNPGEMWLVVKSDGSTGPSSWEFGTDGSTSHYPYAGVVYDDFGSNSRRSFTPTLDITEWRLYRVGITDTGSGLGTWFAHLDNTVQASVAGATRAWNPTPALTGSFAGNIAEVLLFNRSLTSGEVADLITYFNSEHGLTVAGGSSGTPTTTGSSPVTVGSSSASTLIAKTTGGGPVSVGSSSSTTLLGVTPVTTGTSPVSVGSSSATSLVAAPSATTTGASPVSVGSSARTYTPGAALPEVSVSVGVKVEVGALTLLNLKALPGVDVPIGLDVNAGDSQAVVPLPGVSVDIGLSLIGRQVDVSTPDPRRRASQWRYVMTDLANTPLGELTDLEHDPVEDGVGEPATMQFTIATDSDESSLIKPIERQCQVWDGDRLLLRGPVLPGRPSDDGTSMTYQIHDPSWFWRDGRRVITRTPQKNLLHNGDFKFLLSYWTRGYDADSKPKAAPNVRVVSEDFTDDTDGLNPIKAAEIFGVESVTESELSSNAVFWPNLATFRPGGKASIETVANAMPTTAGLKVTVIGHTANDGTGNGLGLSKRRADAAAAIIHAKRPSAVITTKGVGFYDPKPGYPIGSQEQRRVVIQYDQTITGESKQWMRQTVEVTQPKEARYPLVLTAAAMLKVTDDWSVPDANMTSVKIVARRKGAAKPLLPWDEQLGVGSASISDTDPVDRWIPQTAEATVPADGRTYLVDVYLYAPAAQARYTAVGLFPEEQLYFWGVDQALIFKGVMEHIQDPAFGYADLGVATRTPLTGVRRDREWSFRDLTPADTALDGLMGISRGIEWDTVTTPTTTTATTFYPRQGKSVDYVLALGSNVIAAVPANTRDVGSAIIAQAQGLGSYRAVAYASDKRAFGGTLIQRVVTAEQDAPLNELGETAKSELAWARTSTPSYWVDIDPDCIEEVLANTSKGDTVRLILDHPEPVDQLARIVRRQIHPDSLRLMLAFEEV